jgi:WD40 repeat protein
MFHEIVTYRFEFIDIDGYFNRQELDFMEQERRPFGGRHGDSSFDSSRFKIDGFSDFAEAVSFSRFQDTVAIIDGHKNYVTLIDTQTGVRIEVNCSKSPITIICQDGGWLVTASPDATINAFARQRLKNPVFSIPVYRDKIACAISSDFGLMASGTRDGFLVLSSLTRGSNVHVIDLDGCRPYAVLITKAWGFVVTCSTRLVVGTLEHSLSVYTANGGFVRRRVMQDAMTAWTTWNSETGFDYVILAGEPGKLYYCEAFYLDITALKGSKWSTKIVDIRYNPREFGVVMAFDNGDVILVPLVHDG